MTLTLNTASGVLHRSRRCAGRDTRFHYVFRLETEDNEELIGFLGIRYERFCLKCWDRRS